MSLYRKIKFRVWDTTAGSYLHQSSISIDGNGNLYSTEFISPLDRDLFIVEFTTSSHDKHGNELYENDIVLYNGLNYLISWNGFGFVASCPNYNKHHWPTFNSFERDCLVSEKVGNAHENSDLLQ